jgi:hypothetical protein
MMEVRSMKYLKVSFILFISFVLLGVTIVNVTGCLGFGKEKWKEEVQLSDGRIIVIERELLREGGGDEWVSNRNLSKHKEYRIRFPQPDRSGKLIEWRSTRKTPSTWPEIPLILDIESGQPIIFSIADIRDHCEIYIKYIYRNGAWIEEVLPKMFEKRTTNLLLKLGVDMPSYVDLKTKRKLNAEIGYRKSIRQVGPNREVCG